MKLKEVREIIEGSELSEGALNKAREIMMAVGNDEEVEVSDEIIDQLMAILDVDIDTDKLELEACEDTIGILSGFIGEVGAASKMAGDEVEVATKNIYNDASKLFEVNTNSDK